MKKISIMVTFALALISLAFVALDYLALTDIWHNREPDLSLEWTIVTVSFFPIVLFFVSFFIMVSLVVKDRKK